MRVGGTANRDRDRVVMAVGDIANCGISEVGLAGGGTANRDRGRLLMVSGANGLHLIRIGGDGEPGQTLAKGRTVRTIDCQDANGRFTGAMTRNLPQRKSFSACVIVSFDGHLNI